MSRTFHRNEPGLGSNQAQRILHFGDGPKRVACSADKQAGRPQSRQVLHALLFRLPRRMQWVGHEQESLHKFGFLRAQHGRLPSSIGMPAKKNAPARNPAQRADRILQSLAIPRGIAGPWWPVRTSLPVRQIAAQHDESLRTERFRERAQQWPIRIRSRTMSQDQPVASRVSRTMQEALDRRGDGIVLKRFCREIVALRYSHDQWMIREPHRSRVRRRFLELYFLEALMDLHDADLVRKFRPTALCFRILERSSA
jgi:hypothetical protein